MTSSLVLPAQATTYHNLILTVIGTAATISLAELIKTKKEVPVRDLVFWAAAFGAVTVISVWSIARASK